MTSAVSGPPFDLFDEERDLVARAVPRRLAEFSAGRYCAREAIRRVGGPTGPILAGQGREPLWPAGYVGTITHAGGIAAACAARARSWASLGIDLEVRGRCSPSLWAQVLSSAERARLEALRPPARVAAAEIAFSAKEAAYKCLFPILRRWIGFHEVEVKASATGALTYALPRPDGRSTELPLRGRFDTRNRDFVWASVGVRHADLQRLRDLFRTHRALRPTDTTSRMGGSLV